MTKHEPFCPMVGEETKPEHLRLIGVYCTCRKDRGALAKIAEDVAERLSDLPIDEVELAQEKDIMSRKPTLAGAKRAVEILARVCVLAETIDRLTSEIDAKATQIKDFEKERQRLQSELGRLLRKMDCNAPDNTGWEDRVAWLVSEMFRYAKK